MILEVIYSPNNTEEPSRTLYKGSLQDFYLFPPVLLTQFKPFDLNLDGKMTQVQVFNSDKAIPARFNESVETYILKPVK